MNPTPLAQPMPDTLPAASKFIRLASIEIRFDKKKEYLQVVTLYCQLLKLTPVPDPKDVQRFYSYPIGHDDQKMELRFSLKGNTATGKKNRTVLYWEVADGEIMAINKELCSLPDFTSVEPVTMLAALGVSGGARETQRSVIEDSSGNLFGPIGNPPFPFR